MRNEIKSDGEQRVEGKVTYQLDDLFSEMEKNKWE